MRRALWWLLISVWMVGSSPAQEAAMNEQATCRLTLRLEVPAGTGPVFVTGNLPAFGPWQPGLFRMQGDGTERTAALDVPCGTTVEYKFTLGSWSREALADDGSVPANHLAEVAGDTVRTHRVTRFKDAYTGFLDTIDQAGILGHVEVFRAFQPRADILPRDILIWLPPDYHSSDRRYPVLYMHDGQNLFDPRMSTTGIDWGVDEAIVRLAEQGRIEAPIVVAPFCTDDRRAEYSPHHKGPEYARFLNEELKPIIDREYRTRPGREDTTTMGSSMGGLVSLYLAASQPDVFGKAGCVSTHFPWENGRLIEEFEAAGTFPSAVRLYFDYGTVGIDSMYEPYQDRMTAFLKGQGFVEGEDFIVIKADGADHNEAAWRARLETPLLFLFGM
ncbi:MAG: hypothetical protein KF858_10370 [Candidatus Sumerlaeia bacterium]|nr:hypothetical protein [Candidatus Sumerlaeia bacterium]